MQNKFSFNIMHIHLLLFLFAALIQVDATHYRGGTASWKYISSSGNAHTFQVTYKIGWRRDWDDADCDDSDIAGMNPMPLYPLDEWDALVPGTNPRLANLHMICLAYDIGENWAYGYNTFTATVTATSPFSIRYTRCCWIDNLALGETSNVEWVLRMFDIDWRTRSDTGTVNTPPVTTMPPVVTLYVGCPQTFTIPTTDDDQDEVRCRYGVGKQECGDVCGEYSPFFTLNEEDCTIFYDGAGSPELVPVALILEDHRPSAITIGNRNLDPDEAISRIPLQFIAKIISTPNCDVPTFTGVTPSEGDVICLRINDILDITLQATPSASSGSITQFVVTGPGGLIQTPIQSLPNGDYETQVTWDPPEGQSSDVNVCFYARDSFSKVSETRCFTIIFSCHCDPSPCLNGGTCTISTLTDYLCTCPETYYGRNCDCR